VVAFWPRASPCQPAHRMKRISNKTAAETVLRELPSVLGAYVSEDLEGQPREIHVLVRHGPNPAALARDIRGLLEERLGIPVDQRIISMLAPMKKPRPADRERAGPGTSVRTAARSSQGSSRPWHPAM
jgi:hypothetical protein